VATRLTEPITSSWNTCWKNSLEVTILRKAITRVEAPYLSLHIDYDYLTVGEMGNILIRLQAVLRSLADIGRGQREQPRFIISSIKKAHSLEIVVMLSIITVTASIPQNLTFYREVASKAFHRFKMSATAFAKGRGLEITVTKGKIDYRQSQKLLEELSLKQRKKLSDFVRALTRPANSVVIRDEDSAVTLKSPELPKLL
jgi:hypothetical protein